MRSYFLPCLILLGIALLGVFIALSTFQKVAGLQLDVSTMKQEVADDKAQRTIIASTLDRLDAESRPANNFIKQWQRSFLSEDDAQGILPALDSLAVTNVISSSDKQNRADPGYTFRDKIIPVESVKISVSGDYYRLLNWLGAVEQQFPLARVEAVSFTNQNGLKMTSTFSFPICFRLPTPASATP
jgi:hypothetical protein